MIATMATVNSNTDWSTTLGRIARQRDKEQFAQLYDYFAPLLKGFLISRGAEPALAEELLQETLLQVWNKANQFDSSRGNVAGWIYRMARNRYFDHLRRQKLRDRPPPEPELSATEHEGDAIIDRNLLSNTLQQLPQKQAQVLYMSYYQGLSHAEISASLEIPLGSVKSNLRLAFEKLRSSLGGAR